MKACRLFYSASSVSQVLPPQFQYALYWALILLDLAHYLSSASICSIFVVLYVFFYRNFDIPYITFCWAEFGGIGPCSGWLTIVLQCYGTVGLFGYLTHKIVSEIEWCTCQLQEAVIPDLLALWDKDCCHEPTVPQYIMWPSIACTNRQVGGMVQLADTPSPQCIIVEYLRNSTRQRQIVTMKY